MGGEELIQRKTELSANLVMLGRFLRQKGYTIGIGEEAALLQTMQIIPVNDRLGLKSAFKILIAKDHFQFANFDDDFDEFWFQLKKAVDSRQKKEPRKENQAAAPQPPAIDALKSWLFRGEAERDLNVAAFSPIESLTKKDFAAMDKAELRLITRLLKKIARHFTHRKSRLRVKSKRQDRVDLRNTARVGMRYGGEWPSLRYTKPKEKKLKLLLICDVSRSMELYSRFFIHLVYAFQNTYDRVNTWVFSTAIHDVTGLLKNYEFEKAFQLISDRVPQWSGGTKIGECLSLFIEKKATWTMDRKTVVFIVSDGWDTGNPEKLSQAMSAIHKKARKVIWLNPLLGSPGFSPEVSGLKSALPFIDVHAACHNLQGLKKTLYHLKIS